MPHVAPALPPPLAGLLDEFDAATRRLDTLVELLDEATWTATPPRGGWSPAACVEHLNITSARFLPTIEAALGVAAAEGRSGEDRYALDFFGRLLLWFIEPPSRVRVRTPPTFDPALLAPIPDTVARFVGLQDRLRSTAIGSRGLRISDIKIASPFDARLRYSVYSAFRVIASHQRRHLWQAERGVEATRSR